MSRKNAYEGAKRAEEQVSIAWMLVGTLRDIMGQLTILDLGLGYDNERRLFHVQGLAKAAEEILADAECDIGSVRRYLEIRNEAVQEVTS